GAVALKQADVGAFGRITRSYTLRERHVEAARTYWARSGGYAANRTVCYRVHGADRAAERAGAGNRADDRGALSAQDLILAGVDVLVGYVHQQADLADVGIPAIGDQETHLRINMVGQRFIHGLAAEGEFVAVKVERPMQANIDQARNTALYIGGGRGLVHIDTGQQFGWKVSQGDGAPRRSPGRSRREDRPAIQQRLDVRQAANKDDGRLDIVANNRDAGDMLQRFHKGVVRQLADVFGDDRVDDLAGILLDFERVVHGRSHAGDRDCFRRRLLGLGRPRGGQGDGECGCSPAQQISGHHELPLARR